MARRSDLARLTQNFFNFIKTRFTKHGRVFFFWNHRSCFITWVGNYFEILFVAVAIHTRVFFFEIGSIRPISDFLKTEFF